MGQVYVVNPSPTKVFLSVNGAPIPTAWPAGVPGFPYRPYIVSATLIKRPQAGFFNLGDNTVTATFSDQEGPGYNLPLNIPSGVSVDQDLVLYVFRGYGVLLSQFGYLLSTAGVPVPPPPDQELPGA